MEISIVIPAYNEEKSISQVIDSIQQEMANNDIMFEIIVIDDGSNDQTARIIENKKIRLLKNIYNRGYGAALKLGISKAQYSLILIIDADGTYPASSIPDLVRHINEADMVVGARVGKDAKIPFVRRPARAIIGNLANYLTSTKIPDLNSGLRLFKKDIIEKYMNILPDGFSFTTTLTLAMITGDYRVRYIPISYNKRFGKSKIRPIRDTLNFIQLIIRTVMYFNPLKVFIPLSLTLFFMSLAVFLYSYFFTPKVMDITTVILFLVSIQTLTIGMLADLIDKRLKA